jgi:hypothetical protein
MNSRGRAWKSRGTTSPGSRKSRPALRFQDRCLDPRHARHLFTVQLPPDGARNATRRAAGRAARV